MKIFAGFQWLFSKIFNFLFGKTGIFIFIFGWFLVITAAIMLINPEKARKNMAGRGFWYIKFFLNIIALFLAMFLLSFGFNTVGAWPKWVMLGGLIVLIILYKVSLKRIANLIGDLVQIVPVNYLKIYAVIQLVIGGLMIFLHKRIWF